jgi:hypothetical protein
MRLTKIMSAAAAVALAAAPVAQAVAADRAAAPVAGANAMGGESAIAPIFALLAFVVFLVASSGEDDPVSP